ncbi:MAG: murein hydrolase activator EnvC [Hyphomonadaceae bacterium]
MGLVVVFLYRIAGFVALAACAAGGWQDIALAQPSRAGDVARLERQRSQAAAEAQRLQRQARATQVEMRALSARLVEAGRRRAAAEAEAAAAEEQLGLLRRQQEADMAVYARDRETLEDLIIAAAFAEQAKSGPAVRDAVFAGAAAPSLQQRLMEHRRALTDARQLAEAIETQKIALAEAQQAIDAQRRDTEMLISQRRTLYASLNADAASAQRRAERLAGEARSLRDRRRRLAAAERTARARAPSAAGAALPASWLAPASGRIVTAFGAREGGAPPAQGARLAVRTGAQIVAPASARVAYAGLFRSYGQVLILNLDGGYALVLTGLETVRARAGETVAAGQPVGEMSGAISAPVLYVEVRRDGRPIDPGRWLAARGVRTAQLD